MVFPITEGARWSSGINAANGARGPRFASRILPPALPPAVQPPQHLIITEDITVQRAATFGRLGQVVNLSLSVA